MSPRYDVLGFGEASIDEVWRVPRGFALGGKARAVSRDRIGGGQIATALVAAARLGARAGFLGPLGDDALGDEITRGLVDDGVAVLDGARIAGLRSRSALILVSSDGDRSVIEVDDRASPDRASPDLASIAAHLRATRVLHLDGTRPRTALALARAAREAGAWIAIDVDHLPAGDDGDAVRALVSLATLCVLPRDLPGQLTGEIDARRALATLQRQLPSDALVVETRGAEGSLALNAAGFIEQPANAIEAIDSTGCGDTFRGALIVARLERRADADALRFATRAAALKCRDLGRRGCPRRAEVDALRA